MLSRKPAAPPRSRALLRLAALLSYVALSSGWAVGLGAHPPPRTLRQGTAQAQQLRPRLSRPLAGNDTADIDEPGANGTGMLWRWSHDINGTTESSASVLGSDRGAPTNQSADLTRVPLGCKAHARPMPGPCQSHASHAMPTMPCHAMPCHAMPCHAMPCYGRAGRSTEHPSTEHPRALRAHAMHPRGPRLQPSP